MLKTTRSILKKIICCLKRVLAYFRWRNIDYIVRKNHKDVVSRLQKKENPLRVMFYVSENSKWCCQSLYDTMAADACFEPFIAISSLNYISREMSIQKFEENDVFFRSRGMNVVRVYDPQVDEYLSLQEYGADIIFYQQPWEIPPEHDPVVHSDHALSCYVPYGTMIANNDSMHYGMPLQRFVWRYFAPSPIIKELFLQTSPQTPREKIIVSGYPKLDIYLDTPDAIMSSVWKSPDDIASVKKIIWAPHFTFGDTKGGLQYGTFDTNYQFLLKYATDHPQTSWVFKPHPRLSRTIVEKDFMSESQCVEYYQAWRDLPNATVYDTGDYFDIFKTSDALITDCGSFLAEYLFTKKPILHLINPNSVGYNKLGQAIVKDFYKICNTDELEAYIRRVILDADDYLFEQRTEAIKAYPLFLEGAGNRIMEHLKSVLR